MNTSRITVSSFLVAAMSVYACLLLGETPAYAWQSAAVNRLQGAGLAQDNSAASQTRKGEVRVSRLPLTQFARRVFSLHERGKLDLGSAFELVITGKLSPEGQLQGLSVTQRSGDPALSTLAAEFVRALNESGALAFLEETKNLRLAIASSAADFKMSASYEAESESQARQKSHTYDTLFFAARMIRRRADEELIYKGLKVSSKDREVIFDFSMPRETFCALLSKYLSSN